MSKSEYKRALSASMRDGIFYALMVGAGETYLGPLGIFLNANFLQIGLLSTLPQLLGAIVQASSVRCLDLFRSRRSFIFAGVIFTAFCWLLISLVPLTLPAGTGRIVTLIALACIYFSASGIITPIWNSLIGDMVASEVRGNFFGQRNKYIAIFTFLAMLGAGKTLGCFQESGIEPWGFFLIFLSACVSRLISGYWITQYEDPPFHLRPEHHFSFFAFLKRSPRSNFARFVYFGSLINFGVYISAPYFAVYMLRDLKFTFFQYTVVQGAAVAAQFLTTQYWGVIADRFGNKRILNICGFGVGIVPILWLFSANIPYLLIIQAYSGFVWAGYNLATQNFIFDAVTPPKLARCVAYQGLINGLLIFSGSLVGGFAASKLEHGVLLFGGMWQPQYPILAIFLFSGFMRLQAAFFLLPQFREVRSIRHMRHRDFLYEMSQIATDSFRVSLHVKLGKRK